MKTITSSDLKDVLSVISKLKLQDFAIKEGIFGKDLFGTYIILKMKEPLNFHCLSEKHAKMLALMAGNASTIGIDNVDNYCVYNFYNNNQQNIGMISIPEGAFEISDTALVKKIEEIEHNKKCVFEVPVKLASKLIEIVSDINTLSITKKNKDYIIKLDYNDNVSEINIKEKEIKDFEQSINLPVTPFYLLVSTEDAAELVLSDEMFMIKSKIQNLEMYVISSYSADSKEIIAMTENIELKDLL